MMSYQTLLHELAPDLNPAGIEASMRLHYGNLNHLPRETFAAETKLAADLEVQSPSILRKIAERMGMADDFAKWEASHAA
jgi:hypothetical protein